jgi:3-oxoacyl-[acyl-carrier-protein] synthase-1/3-oxoacyl-[acyl-carrier-protein] synthase II
LSETYDFLTKLYESGEKFSSPTDFVGSVHNAPAGQIALWFKAQGANITTTGGDFSFEQAVLMASLCNVRGQGPALLIGADEAHPVLTPLFDPSAAHAGHLADGGGALLVSSDPSLQGPTLNLAFLEPAGTDSLERLFQSLGSPDMLMERFAAILVGMPAAQRDTATLQLERILAHSRFTGPVVDYRRHLGEFASAGAVAAALSVAFVRQGALPAALTGRETLLQGRGILLLGLGETLSAIEILA